MSNDKKTAEQQLTDRFGDWKVQQHGDAFWTVRVDGEAIGHGPTRGKAIASAELRTRPAAPSDTEPAPTSLPEAAKESTHIPHCILAGKWCGADYSMHGDNGECAGFPQSTSPQPASDAEPPSKFQEPLEPGWLGTVLNNVQEKPNQWGSAPTPHTCVHCGEVVARSSDGSCGDGAWYHKDGSVYCGNTKPQRATPRPLPSTPSVVEQGLGLPCESPTQEEFDHAHKVFDSADMGIDSWRRVAVYNLANFYKTERQLLSALQQLAEKKREAEYREYQAYCVGWKEANEKRSMVTYAGWLRFYGSASTAPQPEQEQ